MSRTAGLMVLAAALGLGVSSDAHAAKGIAQIIAKRGVFAFSDGSSVFRLRKGGAFEMHPLSMSGRMIKGVWRSKNHRTIVIYGRWSWLNGASLRNDYRRMKLQLSFIPPGSTRRVGMRRETVWSVYFVIDELVRISKAQYSRARRSR